MDAAAVTLHETVIRLAKGVVTARERHAHTGAAPAIALVPAGPLRALFDAPLPELKAAVGIWEHSVRLHQSQGATG